MSRSALLAAAACLGIAGAAGTAMAQSNTGRRVIEVPEGAVVLVLPSGAMQTAAMPWGVDASRTMPIGFAGMPDLDAMMRQMHAQMNAMMVSAQRAFSMPSTIDAAMREMPSGGTRVVVTSFSDGRHSCMQRVVYGGGTAAPIVQTSGDSCGAAAGIAPGATRPVAEPETVAPRATAPRTIQVMNRKPVQARPIEVAELAR